MSLILLIIIGSKVVHRLFIYHCCMFVSTFHIVYFAEAVLRVNLSPKQTGRADLLPPLSPILGLTNFLQLLDINTILYHAIPCNTMLGPTNFLQLYKESVNPRPQPSLGNPSKALWAHCHLGRDGIFQEWPQQNIQNTLVFVLLTWKDTCNRQKCWNFCKEITTSTYLWESQERVENLQAVLPGLSVLGIHEVTSWKLDTGECIVGHAALIHSKIRSRNIENHTFQLKIA